MNRKVLVSFVFCSFFTIEIFGAVFKGGPRTFCGYKQKKYSGIQDFALLNYLYDHMDLTYKISDYSDQLSNSNVDYIISEAFDAWAEVTDLTFTRIYSGTADVDVRFVTGPHGDGHSFDGRGNILAHASYGFVHFDDSENWSTRLGSGVTYLYSVAVHEIGHTLGLDHSTIRRTMMFAYYDAADVVTSLHSDDIEGIQQLYGAKTTGNRAPDNCGNSNAVDGGSSDCWTTGCQSNSWAVVGCAQYGRSERNKISCPGGYMYECCTSNLECGGNSRPASQPNSGSYSECWTTGCQPNSWAVVGCEQYGMTQVDKFQCSGGSTYKCCK